MCTSAETFVWYMRVIICDEFICDELLMNKIFHNKPINLRGVLCYMANVTRFQWRPTTVLWIHEDFVRLIRTFYYPVLDLTQLIFIDFRKKLSTTCGPVHRDLKTVFEDITKVHWCLFVFICYMLYVSLCFVNVDTQTLLFTCENPRITLKFHWWFLRIFFLQSHWKTFSATLNSIWISLSCMT